MSTSVYLLAAAVTTAAHPPLVGDWAKHMNCPFAETWLKHGPAKATELLKMSPDHLKPEDGRRGRRAVCEDTLADSPSPIKDCATMIGMAPCGTVSWGTNINEVCAKTCNACGDDASDAVTDEDAEPANFGGGECAIAPGPMGAAHQLATSPGYSGECKGTPAEGSKYQWPLRWSKVFYRLDLNWKRYDIYNESGVLRALGQVPCDEPDQEEDTAFGCLKDGEKKNVSTVLHRGSQMYFLDWNEDASKVTKCSWMDLQIIGNIRPDWFMDK
eukprot:gene24573-35481_t